MQMLVIKRNHVDWAVDEKVHTVADWWSTFSVRIFVIHLVLQGDRGLPGVPGPSGPPGIGLYGPKVSLLGHVMEDNRPFPLIR